MSLSIRQWLAERQIELAQLERQAAPLPPQDARLAGVAFRIAQDMASKSLTPLDISALAEVLELPLGAAWKWAEPMSTLSVWLLHVLSRKKPLRRNEGTWLTFQVAYLNALQGILEQESQLRRPWLNRAMLAAGTEAGQPLNDPQLQHLCQTLRPGRLSDSQAEQALTLMGSSFLVQQMNSTGIAWFVANGVEEIEARLLIQRLSHSLPGYLTDAIASNALPLAQLQKFARLGNLATFRDAPPVVNINDSSFEYLNPFASNSELPSSSNSANKTFPLNLHRERYRASLIKSLSSPLLGEPFALKDLYVSLKGREDKRELEIPSSQFPLPFILRAVPDRLDRQSGEPVDLMDWAIAQLADTTTIAVIEAPPGCGKTSFCQMFAARVAMELYPNWMPISIRLRDAPLGRSLEHTLDNAFPIARFSDRDGWLSTAHPPCLLILDGLDEMPHSPQTGRYVEAFLDQLVRFQAQDTPRHKIILTTRSGDGNSPLHFTIRHSPYLRRIAIQSLDQDEFKQWFKQWSKLQSKSIAQTYFSFLKQGGVFRKSPQIDDVAALARMPLILVLLGFLHRDGLIDSSIFRISPSQAKFEIYDRICRWLIKGDEDESGTRPLVVKDGLAHACRSPEAIANLLDGRTPQTLRHQMQAAARAILQGGNHYIPQSALKSLLSSDADLPAFFFSKADFVKEDIRHNPESRSQNCIQFSHPNLGEYICAEEIASQLKLLTQQIPLQYGEVGFVIDSPTNLASHIYALLGYGLLSPEIVELTIERLRREAVRHPQEFSFLVLFERLNSFYKSYGRGRWLDTGIAHQEQSRLQARGNLLNTLQVDAAVGINVFVLLCAIAREAKAPFWPCGNPSLTGEFDPNLLLTLIGRTAVLSPTAFWQMARSSLMSLQLAGACLNRAMLASANLWQANLSAAELIETNLVSANLQEANLSRANLVGACLQGANLSGAWLEGADLSGANLQGANLTLSQVRNACLFQAQLDEETRDFASLNGAIFSLEEFQTYNRLYFSRLTSSGEENTSFVENGLVNTDFKSTLSRIAIAEGEAILPVDFEDEEASAPTIRIESSDNGKLLLPDEPYNYPSLDPTLVENQDSGNL